MEKPYMSLKPVGAASGIHPASAPSKATKKSTALKRREKRANPRSLRPGQAGLAWEKLRRAVRDRCLNHVRERLSFRAYGPTMEFESVKGSPVVTLAHHDGRIFFRMKGAKATIRIIRLKNNGVGFELREQIYSATRLVIEIVCQTREVVMQSAAQGAKVRRAA